MSSSDNTVAQRVKQQRELRQIEGWEEVRVWVPTKADAEDLRMIAAERRAKAESLEELPSLAGTIGINQLEEIRMAIAAQGSPAYNTPSGPVLTLLTEFANAGDLASISRAFVMFARAKPTNAAFVSAQVPGKILNGYFLCNLHLDPAQVMTWAGEHPKFGNEIEQALRDEQRFQALVSSMAESITRRPVSSASKRKTREP